MKICTNCVLPETFPGIRFNERGVCNYCQDFRRQKRLQEEKLKYKRRFEDLIKEHKGKGAYDGLMVYSGGKDSTYTLQLIKKRYRLNVLAFTLDNGFLPNQTLMNIKNVVEKLGVDHMFFKPRFETLRKIFVNCSRQNIFQETVLTRASSICTACITIVKFSSLRLALEKGIPLVIYGWSPGQIPISSSIMKYNAPMVRRIQGAVADPLVEVAGKEIKNWFLEERHFIGNYFFPYNVSPLAFLDYNEAKILNDVASLGWKRPSDLDANSTNCLLNSFANAVHIKKYHFHPYSFEMAKLVREGYMDRRNALKRLKTKENSRTHEFVKKKLHA